VVLPVWPPEQRVSHWANIGNRRQPGNGIEREDERRKRPNEEFETRE
jgi:hypothetical protein